MAEIFRPNFLPKVFFELRPSLCEKCTDTPPRFGETDVRKIPEIVKKWCEEIKKNGKSKKAHTGKMGHFVVTSTAVSPLEASKKQKNTYWKNGRLRRYLRFAQSA